MLLYSSLPKIHQPYDFLSRVYSYERVGPTLGVLVAIALAWLELLAGICLVGGVFLSGALLVRVAMATMFPFVLAYALWRGLEISCGCFDAVGAPITPWTLIRACVILSFSIAAYAGIILSRPLEAYRPKTDTEKGTMRD